MSSLIHFVELTLAAIVDHGDFFLPPIFLFFAVALVLMLRRRGLRPRSRTYWPTVALCVWAIVVAALAFCFERGVRAAIERRVARISLVSFADGTVRSVADYNGKVVLLNFWATWAHPAGPRCPTSTASPRSTGSAAWSSFAQATSRGSGSRASPRTTR